MDGNCISCGNHFIMSIKIESLSCIPETNTILYVNYSAKEKKEAIKEHAASHGGKYYNVVLSS